jgi:hypothetical protein
MFQNGLLPFIRHQVFQMMAVEWSEKNDFPPEAVCRFLAGRPFLTPKY